MCLHFSRMLKIEHRAVIKFFTRKGLNAMEISKSWIMFTRTLLHRSALSSIRWPSSRIQNVASKMHLEWARPSIITADENIETVERIVMHDRQISIHRLGEELTIIHEIMNNYMGMKKVCTQWVPKLLTPIQRVNRVNCC